MLCCSEIVILFLNVELVDDGLGLGPSSVFYGMGSNRLVVSKGSICTKSIIGAFDINSQPIPCVLGGEEMPKCVVFSSSPIIVVFSKLTFQEQMTVEWQKLNFLSTLLNLELTLMWMATLPILLLELFMWGKIHLLNVITCFQLLQK